MPVLLVAGPSAEAAFAFQGGAASIALDVHLEDRGVVDQAIDDGQRHRLVAEYDTMPQDRNSCQPACGSSMRPTRFTVSGLRSAQARRVRRIGWIRVVLPDGRHRWIARKATDLDDAACEARPNRDLPAVSVRTLLPLAEYVRARLSAAREEVDGTSGPAADLAVRTGIAGSLADPRPQGVADDDAESAAAASARIGAAAPDSSCRS